MEGTHTDAWSLAAVIVSVWLALEVLFYVMVRHVLLPKLQPLTRPPAYPVQAQKLMTKVCSVAATVGRSRGCCCGCGTGRSAVDGWLIVCSRDR